MKCFRCGRRTGDGLFIRLERQRSPVNPETHPVCPDCAVNFWRWADEVRTSLTHEKLVRKREELEEREKRLRQREAEVKKMTRKLERELDLRELEVVARVR
ncbi:MAG: hypothetical protein OEY99_01805 [Aigarchaeota archaeon]|nr:hypothetical protein [Aigarchaeota archaeon]